MIDNQVINNYSCRFLGLHCKPCLRASAGDVEGNVEDVKLSF